MLNRIKKFVRTKVLYRKGLGAKHDSWKNAIIPQEQLKSAERDLLLLHKGMPPPVHQIVSEALDVIPKNKKWTLFEAGCASGYYSEVIATLKGDQFEYTGADYSGAVIDLARKQYPNVPFMVCDICNINLKDGAYDVVLSGAVIVHVKEWKAAVNELCRVAGSYLILHRTPMTNQEHYRVEKKMYDGIPVFFNTFNKKELENLIIGNGFKKIFEKNVFKNEEKGLGEITYVFERL